MTIRIRFKTLLSLPTIALLAACSSSSDPAPADDDDSTPPPPADTTAPTITSISPAPDESGVARDATLSVTFDEAMDATTIDTAALTLVDALLGDAIEGSVSYDAATTTATFAPTTPLALASEFTATVGTAVTDEAGNALAAAESLIFSTVDGAIGNEAIVNPLYGDDIAIAVDAAGNALIVWSSEDTVDPFADNLLASRYDAVSGSFSAPVAIDTGSDDAFEASIAGDADGNAIVIWTQPDDVNAIDQVLASRYDAATEAWSAPRRISVAGVSSDSAALGLAEDGTAIAAWSASDGINPVDVVYSVYDPTADSWSTPDFIDDSSDNTFSVSLAVNSAGNAVATWEQQPLAGSADVVASVYSGGAWNTPVVLDELDTFVNNPQAGLDDAGNALVIWEQEEDSASFISSAYAAAYDASSGSWGSAVVIDGSAEGVEDPVLSMDGLGNAVVAYEVNFNFPGVAAVRYSGGTWGAEVQLDDGTSSSRDIVVASDPRGNALAAWVQGDVINTSRYNVLDDTWGSPVQAGFGADELGGTAIALGPNGDGAVGWYNLADEAGSTVNGNVFN